MAEGSAHQTRGDICQRQQSPTIDSLLPFALGHYTPSQMTILAIEALEAEHRFDKLDQSSEASRAGNQLAEIFCFRGNHIHELWLYSEAYNRSEEVRWELFTSRTIVSQRHWKWPKRHVRRSHFHRRLRTRAGDVDF